MISNLRTALMVATSLPALSLTATAHAADRPATTPAATDGQTTSANSAGQANDKQSLTSSDIIVTASRTAEHAPTTASLTTTQPQSAVTRDFIDNATATSDFNELIALTPGVAITGTGNGYGFGETKATIRGFQDGEYNVTYDSIPFADTNNPTHHSTAFFPSNTIETIVVDRGPGNASQLGQATYGGNINMYSRGVKDEMGGQVEGILGIWSTFVGRAEFQSGRIDSLGGTRIVLTGQFMRSDGALTFSPVNSNNLYGKAVIPLGTHNTLTIMSTWNRNFYYQSDVAKGATCGSAITTAAGKTYAADASGNPLTQLTGSNCAATSDVGLYGRNFGMTNNPALASFYKYNRTDKTTDFSYLRLQSELGSGFSMDNRAYMYGYTNNTLSGNGSTSVAVGAASNVPVFSVSPGTVITGFSGAGTAASPYVAVKGPATDVLGYNKLNKYRVLGYIGQINYDFSMGRIRLGGWYEYADTDRHLIDLDMTTGGYSYSEKFNNGTAAQSALPPISQANLAYVQHSTWHQYQLFGEFEFRPVETLSITPGVKYVHFTRGIDAAVNQKSRTPLDLSGTWTKTLPFVTANWAAMPNWSFYGQYAQGMYVPDLSSFYSTSSSLTTALSTLKPQTTTNYQVGTVWHGNMVSIDVDGYIIDVNNKIGTCTTTGCDTTLLINIGQVHYKGVEGQVSVMPVQGLTVFANGSYNYAHSVTTGAQIAKAPFSTAAAGFIYRNHGFRMSFSQKYTGPQYASEYSGSPDFRLYRIKPYSIGDFAISEDLGNLRLGVTVNNVFNSRAVTAISTSSSGAPTTLANGVSYQSGYGQLDQFSYLPPRSFQVSARIKF